MKRYILTVAAVVGFLLLVKCVSNVHAQEAPACKPTHIVFAELARSPDLSPPREIKGDALERAVQLFNALPPQSDASFATAFVVKIADGAGGGGVIMFGTQDAICFGLRIEAQYWDAAMRTIFGLGA